jgi:hypothetical protein
VLKPLNGIVEKNLISFNMAINKTAKNIIISTTNKEISISKKFSETTEEKIAEATKGNLVLTSMKKIISNGNT